MKRFSPTWMLLALALIAGQWAAIAHSAEHVSIQPHDGLCVLCIQSHNLDDVEHSGLFIIESAVSIQLVAETSHQKTRQTSALRYNIRAPPTPIL